MTPEIGPGAAPRPRTATASGHRGGLAAAYAERVVNAAAGHYRQEIGPAGGDQRVSAILPTLEI